MKQPLAAYGSRPGAVSREGPLWGRAARPVAQGTIDALWHNEPSSLNMSHKWSSLTFEPSDEAVQQLRESWSWLLREPFVPVLFSVLGDVFFEPRSGGVWWLNAGTADVSRVAGSVEEFQGLLGTDLVEEWFMPSLVARLHAAGKRPSAGECFTYVTLPVFREGTYEVSNMNPVNAREHFALTGHILQEIRELPDGAQVRINVGS